MRPRHLAQQLAHVGSVRVYGTERVVPDVTAESDGPGQLHPSPKTGYFAGDFHAPFRLVPLRPNLHLGPPSLLQQYQERVTFRFKGTAWLFDPPPMDSTY